MDHERRYRYLLWRGWDSGRPRITFVMLNPSTADASTDDPTIRRCRGLAQSWGFGSMEVVNLFAYRTPDWRNLSRIPDPIGPGNDQYVISSVRLADMVLVAWGNHGGLSGRSTEFVARIDRPVHCVGLTLTGQPRHPLYVHGRTRPIRLQLDSSGFQLAADRKETADARECAS